jgi:hypothetical protein
MPEESVSLREFLQAHVNAVDRRLEGEIRALKELWHIEHVGLQEQLKSAIDGIDRAVTKAETANERRFEGVNEFRSTLSDQQRQFIPRLEVEAVLEGINQKIAEQEKRMAADSGERKGTRMGSAAVWGIAAMVFALILTSLSIAAFFMTRGGKVGL